MRAGSSPPVHPDRDVTAEASYDSLHAGAKFAGMISNRPGRAPIPRQSVHW
jgi:hypothetical protein